jgi:hypothetical protein
MPTHALRRSARRLAAAVLTGLTASCLATGPSPADWQAVGFRTPEQTFRTFRTAFATEQLDLEYRCLSDAFRTREGLDGFSYRQLRDRLEQEIPGLHHLSRAEVRGRLERGPDRVALVARVAVLWVARWFLVELVREEYFEVWAGGERLFDGYTDFEASLRLDERGARPWLWAAVPWEPPLTPGAPEEPAELSQVVLGREWKLDGLEPLEAEQAFRILGALPPDSDSAPSLDL